MNIGIISLWLSFVAAGVILPFMPYMTRKTENFGVTIPEKLYQREDFQRMRKQYAGFLLTLLLSLMIICGVLSYFLSLTSSIVILTTAIIIHVMASFLLYLPFHFKMKKIKQQEAWQKETSQTVTVDTAFRKEKLIYSNGWFLLPGLLTLLTAGVTFFLYDHIPNEIPMHTDMTGNVRYETKNVGNLSIMPLMQLFIIGLFVFVNVIIEKSKQQVSTTNPHRSKQQNVLFRRRWSIYTIISSILMVLLFSFIQLSFIFPNLEAYTDIVITIVIVLILLGTFLLAFKTGQGGSKINVNHDEDSGKTDRDDDRYWKLGQFYVNKNDPSLFIEKRFGVGWTNNWAHPLTWIFLIGIIATPLIITMIFV